MLVLSSIGQSGVVPGPGTVLTLGYCVTAMCFFLPGSVFAPPTPASWDGMDVQGDWRMRMIDTPLGLLHVQGLRSHNALRASAWVVERVGQRGTRPRCCGILTSTARLWVYTKGAHSPFTTVVLH